MENNSNDQKAVWKAMYKILPKDNKTVTKGINIDKEHCLDDKKIANPFNNFFANPADRLFQIFGSIPDTSGSQSIGLSSQNLPPFTFIEVTEQFTSAQLESLKASKSCGLDNIPPRLFKDSAEIIAKPLTKITNLSLSLSSFPRNWKSARVTPLHKKGNSNDMDNHRPISILPVASKLLKSAVHQGPVVRSPFSLNGV